jgi:hypothetical protein
MVEETDQLAHLTQVLKNYFPQDLTPEQRAQLERGLEALKYEQEEAQSASAATPSKGKLANLEIDGMISDSWFSKNIRPAVLVYLLILYTIFIFVYPFIYSNIISGDSTIVQTLLGIMADMITVVFAFYFGGRTIEKIARIFKEK